MRVVLLDNRDSFVYNLVDQKLCFVLLVVISPE